MLARALGVGPVVLIIYFKRTHRDTTNKTTMQQKRRQLPAQRKRQLPAMRHQPTGDVKRMRYTPDVDDHMDEIVGLTDPFSEQAAGARYPDQGAGRSLTFQQRFTVTFSTDESGQFAYAFNPRVNLPQLKAASSVNNTFTWPATWGANGEGNFTTNLVNTYGEKYRPTSMGLRVQNVLSATNSAGLIVFAKGGLPVLSGSTTFNPANFTSWDAHPMTHGGEWQVTSHPRSADAYDFEEITFTQANTTEGDDAWETIYVYISGTLDTAVVAYGEVYINYEYIAQEDAPIAQMALAQPVLNVAMQTAVNHVQANLPSSHKGAKHIVAGFIKKEGKKALTKHVFPFLLKQATKVLL